MPLIHLNTEAMWHWCETAVGVADSSGDKALQGFFSLSHEVDTDVGPPSDVQL